MRRSISVTLEGVSKVFHDAQTGRDVAAVAPCDFTIEPGELVTLLGPSGCGKTTMLRMIGGFELPTTGRVLIGGGDVTALPPNQRDTAMVFQSYGLFPHMNVFDNVAYGLRLRKVPAAEIASRVGEYLKLVGLEELALRPPSRLSGGQQQRVALARSLIVNPGVLLLDEPLSNLDALLREQMRVEIRRIQRGLGITAVYVTHDRVEAMSLSDRIIVMRKGRIAQIGTPYEIYLDPVSAFVAEFCGKVTFFRGRVNAIEADGCAVEVCGQTRLFPRWSKELKAGDECSVMCRPESMGVAEPGAGFIDAAVNTNVYLGHSMETYLKDDRGAEILVQIDDPHAHRIYREGERCAVTISEEAAKVLPVEAEPR
ncbi:ABC transporter ATP-binding protein [Pyramidobacter sp. C12-8]|uniref:ABC transporter ATP-binding protein n=1 Tax=Pyramidobacter sp. C12-8 TaxID=1943580 RepID=UPI00098F0B69|nr:ABC transporter ATP-binding protein [Pyramidobacter sp. C12-8]OON88671.1 polyamine ABC transporter ATP-binding protein [Pyramidobacter sp. C12-8]